MNLKQFFLVGLFSVLLVSFYKPVIANEGDSTPVYQGLYGDQMLDDLYNQASALLEQAMSLEDIAEYQPYLLDVVNLYSDILLYRQDDYAARVNRGSTYLDLGKFELALEDYNQIIRAAPFDAYTLFSRASVYEALNEIILALSDLKLAHYIMSSEPTYYNSEIVLETHTRILRLEKLLQEQEVEHSFTPPSLESLEQAKTPSDYGEGNNITRTTYYYGITRKHQKFTTSGGHYVLQPDWGCRYWWSWVSNVENEVFYNVGASWNHQLQQAQDGIYWYDIYDQHFNVCSVGSPCWSHPSGTNHVHLYPERLVCIGHNYPANWFRIRAETY